jgi:hypothetical protein
MKFVVCHIPYIFICYRFCSFDDAKVGWIEKSTKHLVLLKKNKLPLPKIKENKSTKTTINYGKGEYFNYD